MRSFKGLLSRSVRLPNSPYCFVLKESDHIEPSRLCAGPQLQLPVFPHLLLRRSPIATGLLYDLWFILRGDLLYVLPCAILFVCFSVLLALRITRLGKRELILVLFVCLIDLCLFGFVGFLSLDFWEGLWFVIVALPGLFSYRFCIYGLTVNVCC